MKSTRLEIPGIVQQAIILTDYAVSARYPGEMEEVEIEDYEEALKISTSVFNWVEKIIKLNTPE